MKREERLFPAELVPIPHDENEQHDNRQNIADIEPYALREAQSLALVRFGEEPLPAPPSSAGAEEDIDQGA